MTLEQMQAQRDALKTAITSGVLTVEDDTKRLTYKSTADQLAALRMLENDIARAQGTTTRPAVIMSPQPY